MFLYLDPGTGSLLLYAILGVCTTLLFLLKKVFYKIRSLIFGRGISGNDKKYKIVIHSEGGRYFHVFESIIESFINNKKNIVYITADSNDPAFNIKNEFVEVICPGNEFKTISFLNNLQADIVLSTTPHLDIYMWKKSKDVKKYVHIFHAPTSVDLYEKYALSFYDVIISSVGKAEETQKYLDEKRKLPEKVYYEAGCSYYDSMIKQKNNITRSTKNRTILYAPSWGTRSSINTIGEQIIKILLDNNYDVIFRPHPQSYISDLNILERIKNNFSQNSNFSIDKNNTGMYSMINSDLMISDFSGVIFDYYYLFKKPILLASSNVNINGYEVEDLPFEKQFDIPVTKQITTELMDSDLQNLVEIIENKINKQDSEKEMVSISNLGTTGQKIYEILMKIESELQ